MKRALLFSALLVGLAVIPFSCNRQRVKIASKKFTESVILGEMITQLFISYGEPAKHFAELGGTRVAFNALVDGQIDAYPEYTGTIAEEILADQEVASTDEMKQALATRGIGITRPLGFQNTYALAMLKDKAEALEITTISDLARYPDLRFGLTSEFMDRGDGWPALARHYGLSFPNVRGLDHDIAYRQLSGKAIDVMDVYSTDAKIQTMGLALLVDDRQFFPRYDAVVLYRQDLAKRYPDLIRHLRQLEGALDQSRMTALNRETEVDGRPESLVAAGFLQDRFGIRPNVKQMSAAEAIARRTLEHLDLVRKSLIPAILVGIPLGVIATRRKNLRGLILNSVGIIQTIPALALLVMLMPLVNGAGGQSIGVGSLTAVIALFLYSLLPIVRSTFTGLSSIEPQYTESALAMGLSPRFRLWHIELPLATRSILSGIKTAAVINIGFATLGALIGAGGYGQPILTGIRLVNTELILQGAIPAAAMAIIVQMYFDWIERWIVPAGIAA
jgi:osmoprotectant transport system permease protein